MALIANELKMRCVEAAQTMTYREIYEKIFHPAHPTMGYRGFKDRMATWKLLDFANEKTLFAGTYEGFAPHGATVQVDGNGNLVQAWIKQSAGGEEWEQLLETIRKNISPAVCHAKEQITSNAMLEIPLFDMHFGVATLDTYKGVLEEIMGLIVTREWDEVNILLGQDLLHNNDMRGNTAKGTKIEKVDIATAWNDSWVFWVNVIETALPHANRVRVHYSKGNHDECISWCFVKALQARYPDVVIDTDLRPRKCLFWNGCFIGYGHCEYTGKLDKLFKDFVIEFPELFSKAKVREIHAGHLHHESVDDGMMVRRLASRVPVDEWSSDNGYICVHKRFQLFEYWPNRLKAIYYV